MFIINAVVKVFTFGVIYNNATIISDLTAGVGSRGLSIDLWGTPHFAMAQF
jgi:hypothetical protein